MSVVHVLRGYDKQTDRLTVQYDVPENLLDKVAEHIVLEEGDSDVFGVYPLDRQTALAMASIVGCRMQVTKDLSSNDFFLESEADIETVNHHMAEIAAR